MCDHLRDPVGRELAAEIVLFLKLLLQLELLLLLLLQLLQIAQQLLRRFWLLPGGCPGAAADPRIRLGGCPAPGRLPRGRLGWRIRHNDGFAVRCLVGGVDFVTIRRRGRRRSWSSRGRSGWLFAEVLPHGQHDPSDGIRLLLRTKQNVVIARAVQQRRQDVTWSPRPKVDVNSFAGKARRIDGCARGALHRPQHVAQSGIFGTDTEQSITKSDLRRSGRCLGRAGSRKSGLAPAAALPPREWPKPAWMASGPKTASSTEPAQSIPKWSGIRTGYPSRLHGIYLSRIWLLISHSTPVLPRRVARIDFVIARSVYFGGLLD